MPNKVFLIDTENVKNEWKSVLNQLSKKDKLLLFYTENSPNVSFADFSNLVNYSFKYEMIPCFKGKNGLDFQLVTYLGYLLRKNPFKEYVILSNDTGFDAVVYFWTGKGKKVSRVSTSKPHGENTNLPRRKTVEHKRPDEKKTPKRAAGKTEQTYNHTNNKKVEKFEKFEKVDNKNGKSFQKQGKMVVSNEKKKRSPEKIQQDTTLKLKEILEVKKGIDFSWLYGELQKHNENDLQDIHRNMVKKWGQEVGTAHYKKLKPHVKEIYKIMKE